MTFFPSVGRGLGVAYLTLSDKPQIIATKPCPDCDGKGFRGYDKWVEVGTDKVNFGLSWRCPTCEATGRLVTAIYTRGISLPPLIDRRSLPRETSRNPILRALQLHK